MPMTIEGICSGILKKVDSSALPGRLLRIRPSAAGTPSSTETTAVSIPRPRLSARES